MVNVIYIAYVKIDAVNRVLDNWYSNFMNNQEFLSE